MAVIFLYLNQDIQTLSKYSIISYISIRKYSKDTSTFHFRLEPFMDFHAQKIINLNFIILTGIAPSRA
jgi:hypothetical protein